MIGRLRFMRDHLWTGARLSAYLDRELGRDEAERIERHTHACPKCHRVLETLRQTLRALRELPAASDAPDDLADAVIERLRAQR
jgi:anti-sigma factor (TIGR02949 family)